MSVGLNDFQSGALEYMNEHIHKLPGGMHEAITAWVLIGRKPGHFLSALLSNDLMEAFARADDANQQAMKDWVVFLYNYCPGGCFGSSAKFEDWAKAGGLARYGTGS